MTGPAGPSSPSNLPPGRFDRCATASKSETREKVANGNTNYSVYSLSGELKQRRVCTTPTNCVRENYLSFAGETFARIEAGVITYTHTDHLDSPVAMTTSAGALLCRDQFSPYGESLETPSCNEDDEGFTGHVQDDATGLTYMQARYYDPVIGRFLSKDPVTFKDKLGAGYFNRYAYVGNDPVNRVDLDGKEWLYGQSSGEVRKIDPPMNPAPVSGELTGSADYNNEIKQNTENAQSANLPEKFQELADAGWSVEDKGKGYSGAQHDGYNNPDMQDVKDVGPIPQGEWIMGNTDSTPTVVSIDLIPGAGTETFGRTEFRVHGDSRKAPGRASAGCIILGLDIRREMSASTDRSIWVYDDRE